MKLGLVLGMIVSPIVLGIIYFVLFTPISLGMKILGRDELKLKTENKDTYWEKSISNNLKTDSFKKQF